jgi:hypothetical protein
MRFETSIASRYGPPYGVYTVHNSLENIRVLVDHGAIWNPDARYDMNSVRRALLACEPEVSIALFKILVPTHACSTETLQSLFSSPRLRQHLANEAWWLARLQLKEIAAGPPRAKGRGRRADPVRISPDLLARYDREDLYNKVWAQPIQQLAKEYGVSDVALAKACKKLLVPVPGRGYWAKKAAGKTVRKQPPLPQLAPPQ